MDIAVEPLQPHDVDDFTAIYWDAFNPPEANMVLPMIYPRGFQPDLKERLRNRVLTSMKGSPKARCFCARQPSTNEILGVSWWSYVERPPQTKQEIDARFHEAKKGRSGGVEVDGMEVALEDAFFRAAFYSEAETMRAGAYMTLKLLAVRPENARKGAGTLLLEHGLEKVDRLVLPAFLHAGVQAKALYERYGFESIGEMPCNALDYGGRSDGTHWCMVRAPRSQQVGVPKDA